MLKSIIAAAVVSVVLVAEVLAAYLMLSGKEGLQAEAAAKPSDGQPAAGGEPGAIAGRAEPEAEVDLGKFSIVIHRTADSHTTRVNFQLIGTVPERQQEEFSQVLAKCQHRLRDQVIQEVQRAEIAEVTDPGLALIKRKILERSNDLLGKPLLRTVVLSDYSLVEH